MSGHMIEELILNGLELASDDMGGLESQIET